MLNLYHYGEGGGTGRIEGGEGRGGHLHYPHNPVRINFSYWQKFDKKYFNRENLQNIALLNFQQV